MVKWTLCLEPASEPPRYVTCLRSVIVIGAARLSYSNPSWLERYARHCDFDLVTLILRWLLPLSTKPIWVLTASSKSSDPKSPVNSAPPHGYGYCSQLHTPPFPFTCAPLSACLLNETHSAGGVSITAYWNHSTHTSTYPVRLLCFALRIRRTAAAISLMRRRICEWGERLQFLTRWSLPLIGSFWPFMHHCRRLRRTLLLPILAGSTCPSIHSPPLFPALGAMLLAGAFPSVVHGHVCLSHIAAGWESVYEVFTPAAVLIQSYRILKLNCSHPVPPLGRFCFRLFGSIAGWVDLSARRRREENE